MDNIQIMELIIRRKHLKYRSRGIFPGDFICSSVLKNDNTFMIMKASPSDQPGTHWLLLLKLEDRYSSKILKVKDLIIIPSCTRICDVQFSREINY